MMPSLTAWVIFGVTGWAAVFVLTLMMLRESNRVRTTADTLRHERGAR